MNRLQAADPAEKPGYRSGVAARLVGVQVDTLRVWERRYGVVGPRVSAGRQRLYSAEDIRRLALIKQLVDMGHSIGAIAALDFATLDSMRSSTAQFEIARAGRKSGIRGTGRRIAVVGSAFLVRNVAQPLSARGFTIAGACEEPAEATVRLRDTPVDLLIVERATLREADSRQIDAVKAACCASYVLILYRCASSGVVRRLRSAGHMVARTTFDVAEIESWCRALLEPGSPRPTRPVEVPAQATEPAPARFDDSALATLAGAPRTIACECPAHLADLVLNLASFERYSADCASDSPEEAALHDDLRRASGHARVLMELALERLAAFEGFELAARRESP